MEALITQISGLLADAREFTPELIARLLPIMRALAHLKLTVALVLMGVGISIAVPVVLGSIICFRKHTESKKNGYYYDDWGLGGTMLSVFGGIAVLAFFFSGLGMHIVWAFNARMIDLDMVAWFAMKGIGF